NRPPKNRHRRRHRPNVRRLQAMRRPASASDLPYPMTRIDFHSNVPDKLAYACRLTRKARNADCRIVILTQDRSQLARLDALLWTFSEQDFLPHVMANDALAAQTPILLTADPRMKSPHHQILINLSDT